MCTSVTAAAVVGPLVGALLAGVVTEVALPPHGVAPLLTMDGAASIIKNPVGAASINTLFGVMFFGSCKLTQVDFRLHASPLD